MKTAFVFFCAFSPVFLVVFIAYRQWRSIKLQRRINKMRLLQMDADMAEAKSRMQAVIAERMRKLDSERSFPE